VTFIFSIVIETAKLDYFFYVLCDKIKGHLNTTLLWDTVC